MSQSSLAAPSIDARTSRIFSRTGFVPVAATVSGCALLTLALAELPFVSAPLPLTASVLFPGALLAASIAVGTRRAAGATIARLARGAAAALVGAFLTAAVFFVGAALSNVLLVDLPTEKWTLAGYALSLVLASICFGSFHRASRTPAARERLERWWREAFVAVFFASGLGATLIDACCFPNAFPWAHLAAVALALSSFSVAATIASDSRVFRGPVRQLVRLFGIAGLFLALCGAILATQSSGLEPLLRGPSGPRTIVIAVRNLLDRDGDGYSAWFGGGDCDDHDPLAYPISTVGRDCLDIVSSGAGHATATGEPIAPAPKSMSESAPKIVVFVTIDAFRCGFGHGERPELTNACPSLTELAAEGRFQPAAHARAPHTLGSLSSIFAYREGGAMRTLPAAVRERGYTTGAVVTHGALLKIPKLRESFDTADESLAPIAHAGHTTTSDEVTDRVLQRVTEAARSGAPTFLWAHYFDAHSPYVQTPGSHWVWSHRRAYVEEVKRTDRALGRLVSSLKAIVPNEELALFVTADHGEEFGEHGGTEHGRTLYEEVVRVPFIAWRSGVDPRRGLPEMLPAGDIDMAPYVVSVVTDGPFSPSKVLLMKATWPNDAVVGVVDGHLKYTVHHQLGYEELFDLSVDPLEKHDLSAERTNDVRSMRRLLGDLLRHEQQSPSTL